MAKDPIKEKKAELLQQCKDGLEKVATGDLKSVILVMYLLLAYQKIKNDGVRPFVDTKMRMKWLLPIIRREPYEQNESIECKYRNRLKPLFDLTFDEINALTTTDVVTFLIMHEQNGTI